MTDHLPCSVSCQQSLRRGVLINNAIKKFNPDWHAKALRLNSNPILYLDNFDFYILEAESASFTDITYKSVVFACDETSTLYSHLQDSNRLKIKNGSISFFKSDVLTRTVKLKKNLSVRKPGILPFHRG